MINVHSFCFNPFQENSYVLYDETGECVIIDPGCSNDEERKELISFIKKNSLKPIKLLNTHCHIDHVLGNAFVFDEYSLRPEIHPLEQPVLASCTSVANMYGINYEESPMATCSLVEGEKVKFGNSELDIIFAPGHAPGHVVFYSFEQKFIIGGDVLFQGSIGRTDLPGGDYETLINSIKSKLLILDNEIIVHPGHGPHTTIGYERENNPFLK